jgi:alkanesulfonate monooxygenase SsuD/methylene tetrahydromethanopterin reductase-like flavin-dependent oxidoreductase (luciferase family)
MLVVSVDYGRRLSFGFFPTPAAASFSSTLADIQLAEELGLELVGIQDHPYQPAFLDTWTMIAGVLMQTSRVGVFPDVANLPLRPPALLAKASASLDVMSGGRLELGVGSGAYWPAITAMGGPSWTPGAAVSALEEAIAIIRAAWSGERSVRVAGRFWSASGYRPGPPPAHAIGIWVGAYGPRMLALTGRLGDGWVPSGPPYLAFDKIGESAARIDDAAAAAGRDPASIRRIFNVWGLITDGASSPDPNRLEWPADRWIDVLSRAAIDGGMDSFLFGPSSDISRQLRRWAEEIAPAVRANVARSRA